jgi:hypothetical protein
MHDVLRRVLAQALGIEHEAVATTLSPNPGSHTIHARKLMAEIGAAQRTRGASQKFHKQDHR